MSRAEQDTPAAVLQQMVAARLFAGMGEDALRTVLDVALLIDVPAGTELAHEGAAEHDFFVLLEGELSVAMALPAARLHTSARHQASRLFQAFMLEGRLEGLDFPH